VTTQDFEVWVAQHRDELLAVARKRAQKAREHQVELDAEDILHSAIVEIMRRLDTVGTTGLWTYAVKAIRSKAKDAQAAEVARFKYQQEAANDAPPPSTLRARALNKLPRNGKGQIDPTAPSIPLDTAWEPIWDGPMPGIARWRFQTLRDDRRFDQRAVASLAESMHKASRRIRHDGEPGFSYTEFGAENGQAWSAA